MLGGRAPALRGRHRRWCATSGRTAPRTAPERRRGPADDKKQAHEFHTVAVVGERRGGTHYFALDVTDATKLPSEPVGAAAVPLDLPADRRPRDPRVRRDLHRLPPRRAADRPGAASRRRRRLRRANADDARVSGADDTSRTTSAGSRSSPAASTPVPPRPRRPHGGRLDRRRSSSTSRTPRPRPRSPRRPAPRSSASRSPRRSGMVWGAERERETSSATNDGFFDTATFGDTGGQLWVLRFSEPGQARDATAKVTNWYGARAFQMGGAGDCKLLRRAAVLLHHRQHPRSRTAHLPRFAGPATASTCSTPHGGICGPDNIRACVAARLHGHARPAVEPALTAPELGSARRGSHAARVHRTPTFELGGVTAGRATVETARREGSSSSACPSPDCQRRRDATTKDVEVLCLRDAAGRCDCGLARLAARRDARALEQRQPPSTSATGTSRSGSSTTRPPRASSRTRTEARDLRRGPALDHARPAPRRASGYVDGGSSRHRRRRATTRRPAADATRRPGWAIYYDHGRHRHGGRPHLHRAPDRRADLLRHAVSYGWVYLEHDPAVHRRR